MAAARVKHLGELKPSDKLVWLSYKGPFIGQFVIESNWGYHESLSGIFGAYLSGKDPHFFPIDPSNVSDLKLFRHSPGACKKCDLGIVRDKQGEWRQCIGCFGGYL